MGCDAFAPLAPDTEKISHLDNAPDFGLGNFDSGYIYALGKVGLNPDLIVTPYSDTTGDVLGVMLYDPTNKKDYRLDFRFKESHTEASHYYENFEKLKDPTGAQKIYLYQEGQILTNNQFQYDTLELKEYRAEKNDVWVFDERVLLLVIGTSYRPDGFVNIYFKHRNISQ